MILKFYKEVDNKIAEFFYEKSLIFFDVLFDIFDIDVLYYDITDYIYYDDIDDV
jgi:hypothetical protein